MFGLIVAASAVFLAGQAQATSAAPQLQQAQQQPVVRGDPNEMVCERQKELGSRLSAKRICKTRAQWASDRLENRQEVERVQTQRGMKGN